jgi:hypothetical protein
MSEPRYALDDFNTIPGQDPLNGKAERDSWLPVNLALLPAQPPVKPTLGHGLVYPGLRHVFSGPQESAKTLAAYAIGLQTIRDHPDSTIALIDFEMGAYAARSRLHDLGAQTHELEQIHYIEPHHPANDDRISLLIGLNPILVIIDAAAGAYDLQGLDDNKRQDVGKITKLYVDGFWRNGIATIFLDHVVKNTETRGTYAIGSERKVGGTDVHLGFSVITPISRGHSGLYKITTHKDRGGYLKRGILAEMHLESHPDTHSITWQFRPADEVPEGESWMPTKVMEKISTALQLKQEPVSRNELITQIGGRRDVAVKAIDHLIRLEYITETAGPRGAKLLEPTRHFTVHEWENAPDKNVTKSHVPTCSHLFPEQVHPLVPNTVPPYGGREQVEAPRNTSPVPDEQAPLPDYEPSFPDWLEDLTPPADDDLPI